MNSACPFGSGPARSKNKQGKRQLPIHADLVCTVTDKTIFSYWDLVKLLVANTHYNDRKISYVQRKRVK